MSELLDKIHASELTMLDEIDRVCRALGLTYYLSCGTLLGAVRHEGFIPWDEDLDIMMPRADYETFVRKAPALLESGFRLDDISTNPLYFNPFAKIRLVDSLFAIRALKNYRGGQELWLDIFPMDEVAGQDDPSLAARARTIGLCRAAICTKRGVFDLGSVSLRQRLAIRALLLLPEQKIWDRMKKAHLAGQGDCYVILDTDYKPQKLILPKAWFTPAKEGRFEGKTYPIPADSDAVLTHIYGDYMQIPPKEKQVTFYPMKIRFPDGEEYDLEDSAE